MIEYYINNDLITSINNYNISNPDTAFIPNVEDLVCVINGEFKNSIVKVVKKLFIIENGHARVKIFCEHE